MMLHSPLGPPTRMSNHFLPQVIEEELAGNNEIVMKLLAKDDVDRVFTNCAELQN